MDILERGAGITESKLSPLEALSAARAFCAVMNEDPSTPGRKLCEGGCLFPSPRPHPRRHDVDAVLEHGLSLPKIHWLGMMFVLGAGGSEQAKLGVQMLLTASTSGYLPSVMTVLRFMLGETEDRPPRIPSSLNFQQVEGRFRKHLGTSEGGTDRDTLTLAGVLALARNDGAQALRWFEKAIRARHAGSWGNSGKDSKGAAGARTISRDGQGMSQPRAPRWEWETTCLVGLGRLHLLRGSAEEAQRVLRTAALELGSAQACLELAKALPPSDPERKTFLLHAAVSGRTGAAQLLAETEQQEARASPSQREAAEHARMASGWADLAAAEEASAPARPH